MLRLREIPSSAKAATTPPISIEIQSIQYSFETRTAARCWEPVGGETNERLEKKSSRPIRNQVGLVWPRSLSAARNYFQATPRMQCTFYLGLPPDRVAGSIRWRGGERISVLIGVFEYSLPNCGVARVCLSLFLCRTHAGTLMKYGWKKADALDKDMN